MHGSPAWAWLTKFMSKKCAFFVPKSFRTATEPRVGSTKLVAWYSAIKTNIIDLSQ